MSDRDLRRIEVLSDVRAGRRTVAAAAAVLAVGERQMYRLLSRYETDGLRRTNVPGRGSHHRFENTTQVTLVCHSPDGWGDSDAAADLPPILLPARHVERLSRCMRSRYQCKLEDLPWAGLPVVGIGATTAI